MNAVTFSASDYRPHERCEVWGERIWSMLGQLHAKATGEFSGAVRAVDLGGIKLCKISIGPHEIQRTPELIRRDDRGLLKIMFQMAGRCFLEQDGRQLAISAGEWTIYDTSRPYRVWNDAPIDLLAVLVPRDTLREIRLEPSQYGLQVLSSTIGMGSVVRNFIRSLLEDTPTISPVSEARLGDATVELMVFAILEHFREYRVLPSADVMNARIRGYINAHLRDPSFSIGKIAGALKCSKRYLHKAFRSPNQETLSEFIWNLRLDGCRADLADPQLSRQSVTGIAFSWGFNSAAHFSRSFKARFGFTATDCRAGAKGASRTTECSRPAELSGVY
jgi:AraC-like DNA-binding protein